MRADIEKLDETVESCRAKTSTLRKLSKDPTMVNKKPKKCDGADAEVLKKQLIGLLPYHLPMI